MANDHMNFDRAKKVIRFIETLKIPEGMHQGQPFRLRDFQKDIITPVYAPADEVGNRVVRKAIYSVSKKNGKTPLISGIGLAHLVGPEAKRNEQLYSAAYERDQAAITFRYMKQMIEMDEELSDLLNIKTATKEIENKSSGSVFKALSSESKSKHGLGPALLIFDELAQFGADREFYDTLIQGRGAHTEPLLWIISTQASDDLAVLSQEIDYAQKYGDTDPTVKLFFFTTPPDAEIMDKESWRISNPALGDFLSEADMLEAARTANSMPSAESGFRNLRLNQRTSSTERFMPKSVWDDNNAEPDEDGLVNGRVTAGLDLSGKNDLSSLVLDGYLDGVHHIFPYFWTPLDGVKDREKRDKAPYTLWIKENYLIAKPGKTINYRWIARQIVEIHSKYDIKELRFDRWRIEDLEKELNDIGCTTYIKDKEDPPDYDSLCLVPHGQGFKDLSPAIEAVEDIFISGTARHGGHPVLTMCAANAVVQKDDAGSRKFTKSKSTGRIDGIVAMAMALNGAELPEEDHEPERSRYEDDNCEVFAI